MIGIVGLGLLGSAVGERLIRAGFAVCGYDTQANRRQALETLGGNAVDAASQVFSACEIVLLVLPDSQVVRGVLASVAPRPGSVIVDLTTGDPEQMAEFGEALAKSGVAYLDATVGGSSEQVRGQDAIVMVGGEKAALERVEVLLKTFSREVFHVGTCGNGARMKLAMNLVLGLNRAVLAEGLAFAAACGLSMDDALRVFRAGPAWSRVMDLKGRRMIDRDFVPAARLAQHRKDVDLILAAAAKNGARTPLSSVHRELLREVEQEGFGAEDNSAIIRAFRT